MSSRIFLDDELQNRMVKYGSACDFLTSESDLICSKKRKSSRIKNLVKNKIKCPD